MVYFEKKAKFKGVIMPRYLESKTKTYLLSSAKPSPCKFLSDKF